MPSAWVVTAGTWEDLLANVTMLRIDAEYVQGNDTFGFDNVELTPDPATLPSDFDGDGDVDNADIGLAVGNFTGSSGTGMSYWDGDIDHDGDVDNADIGYVAGSFTGAMPSSSQSPPVPEPATLVLLALGGMAILRRHRKGTGR